MIKKGDTLIEVTLAIGIFSMIAIAIVAVMSGGTVGAQTSLETTLTRQEVDAQAEALRFIHSAYISDKDSNNKDLSYVKLWQNITSSAAYFKDGVSDEDKEILKFTPSVCKDLYNPGVNNSIDKAFVINTRALGGLPTGTASSADINNVFIPFSSGKLSQAQTYPHLIYGTSATNNEDKKDTTLIKNSAQTNLFQAEGIYIVAVRDNDTTKLSEEGRDATATAAFYDFYIRTCWYGVNSEEPSTISTVIRLYDPDAVKLPQITEPESHISDKDAVIANIDGRTFTKTNEGGAYVGYACHTYPDGVGDYSNKSFVGPVLVSKDQNAVAYTAHDGSFGFTDSTNYKGSVYYIGSYERWMHVDSCADAGNIISDAVGKTNKIYTWDDQTLTGEEAVKSAAERLLDDLLK